MKLTRRHLIQTGLAASLLPWATQAAAIDLPPEMMPTVVDIAGRVPQGQIEVYPDSFHLYFGIYEGRAIRYGVGVGRDNLYEPGTFTIDRKQEWPDWRPTDEMIERDPAAYEQFKDGVPGGPDNPLGARALYLQYPNGRDSYLRIHGTTAPRTIGTAVSNGCARLVNEHIEDLYRRVPIGTKVILHPKGFGIISPSAQVASQA